MCDFSFFLIGSHASATFNWFWTFSRLFSCGWRLSSRKRHIAVWVKTAEKPIDQLCVDWTWMKAVKLFVCLHLLFFSVFYRYSTLDNIKESRLCHNLLFLYRHTFPSISLSPPILKRSLRDLYLNPPFLFGGPNTIDLTESNTKTVLYA